MTAAAGTVIVTNHALLMLRRRDAAFAREHSANLYGAICKEVALAFAEDRRAAHVPRWLRQRDGRAGRRSEQVRAARYVWDAQEQRCYVLRANNERGHRSWVVVTVLVRREAV